MKMLHTVVVCKQQFNEFTGRRKTNCFFCDGLYGIMGNQVHYVGLDVVGQWNLYGKN